MIDREKINKFLDALEKFSEESATLQINQAGDITFSGYPKDWWTEGMQWNDEKRHQMLALLTPLIGRLNKKVDGRNIGYEGESEGVRVRLNYVDKCKIVGYKTVKKTVRREIEKPVEFEEVEEEQQVMITDCDIRQGKFTESDIEVTA